MNQSKVASDAFPVHVLIVDDHPNTANMLARAVSQISPRVEALAATSGAEALAHVRSRAVDILITDMVMPDMNGLELMEKLQNHPGGRPARTILVTAYDVPGLRETARRLKVDEFLTKPVRPERVCQIVEETLKKWERTKHPAKKEKKVRKPFKILIADDHPDNVILLTRYMENEGYTCITAADGMEAVDRTRAELPDLVLLDVNMPGKDGFTALEEMRADPAVQHVPVIILTAARLEPMDIQSGLNLGADDYVTKPFDRLELMARIRTRLRVKEAEDALRRRNRELSLLIEIGKELSAPPDIEELSIMLLERAVETLGASLGHILIRTPAGPIRKTYHRLDTLARDAPDDELPIPQGLLETLENIRQGLILDDIRRDGRWQSFLGSKSRSALVAPLFGRRGLFGFLALTHEQTKYFTLENLLLLQAVASQAALAVENAQLYERMAQQPPPRKSD